MQGDTSLVSDTISYEDLLSKDPGRVETLGHKLNPNFGPIVISEVISAQNKVNFCNISL